MSPSRLFPLVALGTLVCVAMTGFFFVLVFWRIRAGQKRRMAAAAKKAKATQDAPPSKPDVPTLEQPEPTPPAPPPSLDGNAPIAQASNTLSEADPTVRMEVRPTGHPDEVTSPSHPAGELSKPNLLAIR